MANTPPIAADIRLFRWHDLEPAQGAATIELARSLGLNPNTIDTNFAVSHLTGIAGQPWRLHLREIQRGDDGQLVVDPVANEVVYRPVVIDNVTLPHFLTGDQQ